MAIWQETGGGTENAALASVLGALDTVAGTGSPGSETAQALIKQIVNCLVGTAGVLSWPGGQVPGANVSIQEVIEQIYDLTNAIPTTMVGTDNAALASVVGALNTAASTGAVTSADEAMAYIKQLITNTLDVHTSGTIEIAGGTDFTAEQTMVEITVSSNVKNIKSIAIDLEYASTGFEAVATAGDILTVYVYHKIDGTNYRQISSKEYTAGSLTDHIWITDIPSGRDVKVTAKVDTDRGAVNFPYSHVVVTNA